MTIQTGASSLQQRIDTITERLEGIRRRGEQTRVALARAIADNPPPGIVVSASEDAQAATLLAAIIGWQEADTASEPHPTWLRRAVEAIEESGRAAVDLERDLHEASAMIQAMHAEATARSQRDELWFKRTSLRLEHQIEAMRDSARLLNDLAVKLLEFLAAPEPATGEVDRAQARRVRTHRPRLTEDGLLSVSSMAVWQAVRETLVDGKHFQPDAQGLPVAAFNRHGVDGMLSATNRELIDRAANLPDLGPLRVTRRHLLIERMWNQVNALSDLTTDVYDYLTATWLNAATGPGDAAVASVDDILRARQVLPHPDGHSRRSGYTSAQREEILQALLILHNMWVDVAKLEVYDANSPNRRYKRTLMLSSQVFSVSDHISHSDIEGRRDLIAFRFRPGEEFAKVLLSNRQIAQMPAKALAYHPINEKWEKRLTRYLTYIWRVNAQHGDLVKTFKVATLLEAVDETLYQRLPSRTKERLEKALDRLLADAVIAAWQYEGWDEAPAGAKGWAAAWLEAMLIVEPPAAITEAYEGIMRGRQAAAGADLAAPARRGCAVPVKSPGGAATLGERMRVHRRRLGLSQMEAAEVIGTSVSTYNRAERDLVTPHNDLRARIERWLATSPGAN